MSNCPKCGLPEFKWDNGYVGSVCACQPEQNIIPPPPCERKFIPIADTISDKPELTQKQIVLAQMVQMELCNPAGYSEIANAVEHCKKILEACKDE